MASVTLTRLWLNLAADTSQVVTLPLRSLEHTPQVNVVVRLYAGGNSRAITKPGKAKQAKVVLGFLTDAQVKTVKAWQGLPVCFRDPKGEKFYGVYTDPDFTPAPGPVGTPATLSVNEITVSEAV